jgi:hypothetical protein
MDNPVLTEEWLRLLGTGNRAKTWSLRWCSGDRDKEVPRIVRPGCKASQLTSDGEEEQEQLVSVSVSQLKGHWYQILDCGPHDGTSEPNGTIFQKSELELWALELVSDLFDRLSAEASAGLWSWKSPLVRKSP